ncbi:MAG TPA: hypothetical protein VIJ61_03930 [Thermoanaerobaculia bacterium]
MRKKMLLLILALAATAASVTAPRAQAAGTHSCQFGCRSCICDASGIPIACTNAYC